MDLTLDSWLLIGTVGMAFGTVILALLALTLRKADRHHGTLAVGITAVAATAYYALTYGLGDITVGDVTVQSARYIDWLVTTPMLLLSLGLLALPSGVRGRSWTLSTLVFLDIYMVATGFFATIADANTKWAWYAFSCLAFVFILVILFGTLMSAVKKAGNKKLVKLYSNLAVYLSALWIAYPLVWLYGTTGQGYLSYLDENTFYTFLDLLAKVGFGFLLLWNIKKLSLTTKVKKGQSTVDALMK